MAKIGTQRAAFRASRGLTASYNSLEEVYNKVGIGLFSQQ